MRKAAFIFLAMLIAIPTGGVLRASAARESTEAWSHYKRGLELRRREDYDAALGEFREALALAPDLIEAHREYQNVMLALGFQEDLVRQYGDYLKKNPRSSPAHYLYGRIMDDPLVQDAEFRKAIALDRGFFWGHFGLAAVSFRLGRKGISGREIGEALLLCPSSMEGRRLEGIVESLSGRHEKALEIFQQLIRKDGDYREAYRLALHECRMLGLIDEGKKLSGRAVELFHRDTFLAASRGYFLARRGDTEGAIASYEKAVAMGPIPFFFLSDLRRLYAGEGLHGKAVDLWRVSFGTKLSKRENRILPLWERLEKAVDAVRDEGGHAALMELARAYVGMGWWAEAVAMMPAAGKSGVIDDEAAAMFAGAEAGGRLLEALRNYDLWFGIEIERDKNIVTFREAVAELGERARRAFGSPLIQPGAIRSMAGILWLGDRPERPQPLLQILREGNRDLVFFDNVFALNMDFNFSEVILCSLERSGDSGFYYWKTVGCLCGAGIADEGSGLTYPPFNGYAVYYDRAKWKDLCDERKVQKRDPLDGDWFIGEIAGRRVGAGEIIYSRILERRLFELVCRDVGEADERALIGRIEDRFADTVAEHEYQHLVDLRNYLPVWKRPLRGFFLACRAFFRPSLIETWFEERAILRSMARTEYPFLSLLSMNSQLGGVRGAHAVACRRVLGRIVGHVASHPQLYPEIDCRLNIMNQLYLLSGEKLNRIARLLYEGHGRI